MGSLKGGVFVEGGGRLYSGTKKLLLALVGCVVYLDAVFRIRIRFMRIQIRIQPKTSKRIRIQRAYLMWIEADLDLDPDPDPGRSVTKFRGYKL